MANRPSLSHLIDRPGSAMQAVVARTRTWLIAALLIALGIATRAAVTAPYQAQAQTEALAQATASASGGSTQTSTTLPRIGIARRALRQGLQAGGTSTGMPQVAPTTLAVIVGLAGLLAAVGGWLLRGGIALLASKLSGGEGAWNGVFAVGVWSMFPYFVRDLLQSAYTLTQGALVKYQGLSMLAATGGWLENSPRLVQALLGQVDLFALWHLLLLTAGLAVACKLGRGKAFGLALLTWAVILAIKLLPALLGASLPLAGGLG
jgi:hypothetical protein